MIGTRLAHYEITNHLGTGGMGEVYQATDAKLRRNVAIKLLPEAFTHDHDRASRFEREAHVLAALNHPNIAAIHGIEEFAGRKFLVMELVMGETLAARINRGPLPLAEALGIATQITHALEAAHEKNIVHRDLKPANVKITPDGNVKVLDFGLAKAFSPDAADPSLSNSPTLSAAATHAGVILGTAAYMSPEQARGHEVDRRTDIFALGCLLYEMLTGQKAFDGEGVPDILGAVLKSDPDWTRLPSEVPTRIRDLLRVCLEKNPKKRRQTATDVRIDIELALIPASGSSPSPPFGARRRERVALVSALALVTLIAALFGAWALRSAPTLPGAWLEINTPPGTDPSQAISPDGLRIIFSARSPEGQPQLWLRSLNSELVRPLKGTEGASFPFWKPDSRFIGFFADNKLKRMDLDDGTVKILVPGATLPLGGAWNSDGTIIFSTNPGQPILQVSDNGGETSFVTPFESPQQRSQSSPQFLPDGRHFLFFVVGSPEARGVYIGQLGELKTKRLFDAAAAAVYVASGHLLFIREGKLLAQGFDLNRLEMTGSALEIAEDVSAGTILSSSASGPIAYRTPSTDSGQQQLLWVDRDGAEIQKEVYSDTAMLNPTLSRDGSRVAVLKLKDGNVDIWTFERASSNWVKITSDPGDDIMPLFSKDDTRMVFSSRRGDMNLYLISLSDPHGSEKLLLKSPLPKFPMDWSADGSFLLYDSLDPKTNYDMWALPMDGDGKPFVIVQTTSNERLSQFSPDNKWIAYQSDKTGRPEIYIQPFRRPEDTRPREAKQISIDGGTQVRWNPKDNTELFYIGRDDRLMTVRIRFASDGQSFERETVRGSFLTTIGRTAVSTSRQKYAVSPNGLSFMMNSALGEISAQPIKIILNWKPKP